MLQEKQAARTASVVWNCKAISDARFGENFMKTLTGIFIALVLFGLLSLCSIAAAQEDTSGTVMTDDIQPYDGPLGPGSPLYGLKLALEDVDESFTPNETERVDKQMNHARLRLSEVRRSLELNQSDSAEQALDNYWMKMNLTNATITGWGSNRTGLLHAQEQIVKHQFVLEHLLETHPNSTGLQRAYNNSVRLEEKFGEKTMVKFNRAMERNNQTILKAIYLEQKEQDRHGWTGMNVTVNQTQVQPDGTPSARHQNGENRDKKSGNENPVTTVTTQMHPGNQQQGQGQSSQQQGGSHPGNKGNGNSGKK
jgi:hypothetical protein